MTKTFRPSAEDEVRQVSRSGCNDVGPFRTFGPAMASTPGDTSSESGSVERDVARSSFPAVVCLCGSTRFRETFREAERREGLSGRIVLTVACFGHSGDLPPEACVDGHPTKTMLDELHLRKIDLADEILVINVGGYIGNSTSREIAYAERHGKRVRYLEPAP